MEVLRLIGVHVELYGFRRRRLLRLAVLIDIHIYVDGLSAEEVGIQETSANKEVVVATPCIGTRTWRQTVVIVVRMRRVAGRMAVRSRAMRRTAMWTRTAVWRGAAVRTRAVSRRMIHMRRRRVASSVRWRMSTASTWWGWVTTATTVRRCMSAAPMGCMTTTTAMRMATTAMRVTGVTMRDGHGDGRHHGENEPGQRHSAGGRKHRQTVAGHARREHRWQRNNLAEHHVRKT